MRHCGYYMSFGWCGPVHTRKITPNIAFCLTGANTVSLFEVRKVFPLAGRLLLFPLITISAIEKTGGVSIKLRPDRYVLPAQYT